jgi:hypothetical protein
MNTREKNQNAMGDEVHDLNMRLAQFGGRGGRPSSWMPGASPIGRGKGHSPGTGINQFGQDISFEGILQSTHRPLPPDDRNLESRLFGLHQNAEEDYINCLPTAIRERVKLKQKIHKKFEALEEAAQDPKSKNNRPWYSQTQLQPYEKSLESRWKNSDELEDDVDQPKPQIQPTRRHATAKKWNLDDTNLDSIFSLNSSSGDGGGKNLFTMNSDDKESVSTPTSTVFDNLNQDDSVKDPMSNDDLKYQQSGTGNMTMPWTRGTKEQQMSDTENQYKDDFGGKGSGENIPLAFDPRFGGEDQYGDNAHAGNYADLMWDQKSLDALDDGLDDYFKQDSIATENKLDMIHKRRKLQLRPQDMETTSVKNDDQWLGNEPRGIADTYPKAFDNFVTDFPKWTL